MKIAIITFYNNNNNYGQKLQAFALSEFLKRTYNTQDVTILTVQNKLVRKDFENECVNVKTISSDPNTYNDYDLYVFGSDQIFGLTRVLRYKGDLARVYDGTLIKNLNKKIISYAGSDGSNTFIRYYNNKIEDIDGKILTFINNLKKNFDIVSFREKNASTFIENSIVSIDPIFLNTKEFYYSIEKKPSFVINDTFDFEYELKNDTPLQISNCNGIQKILLNGQNRNHENSIDPREFLWLIHHCRNFTTCSFHGSAFSILFNKQNIKLADNYRVKHLLIDTLKGEYLEHQIKNYETVNNNIEIERKKSILYFHKYISYGGYCKDNSIHDKCSSGGFCGLLAKYILENNGIIYGARYSEDFKKVYTDCVNNIDDYFKYLAKSKYNFCYMPKLTDIKKQLEENKLILYIGSPCQIWSLKKYLNKDYDNLITVDFKCYGFCKRQILSDFITKYENKYESKIVKLDMRPNHKFKCLIEFENGTKTFDNNSWNIFLGNIMERCKKCKFHHGKKNNYSDITIGDFWENRGNKLQLTEDFNPHNGVSSIYINTQKGYKLFSELKNNLECIITSK